MKEKAIFYHAGCSVCVSAEQTIAAAIDADRYEIEVVYLGENKERVAEAKKFGIASVPALVINEQPFHINFGAALADLK